jgi:DNA-binding SARP family transcriptional activator
VRGIPDSGIRDTHEGDATQAPALWLRLVGALCVCRQDPAQTAVRVDGRKARTVLALLAVERGRLVSMDRIIEAVWQASPPQRPAGNVATLVSRLRSTLGPAAIEGGRAGYRLGAWLRIDLYEAQAMLVEAELRLARDEPARALALARRAGEMLDGGPVLVEQADAAWAEPARARQVELVRRSRHVIAHAALGTGDAWVAQRAAVSAVTADPFDEVAYRALMRAHDAAGEPARALREYRRLRVTLSDELGIDPAPATRDVYVAVLRNQAGRSRLSA